MAVANRIARPLRRPRETSLGDAALSHFPLERSRSSDKRSRQTGMLERTLIAKVCQLLRKFALAFAISSQPFGPTAALPDRYASAG